MTTRTLAPIVPVAGASNPILTPEQIDAATRGEIRIRWQRKLYPLRLTPDERYAFERAQRLGYLVTRRRRFSVDPLANAWWSWCSTTGTAHVCVWKHPRRASAFVALDLATQSPETGPRQLDAARWSAVLAILMQNSRRGALVNDSREWPSSDRIIPDKAEETAARLVQIVRAEHPPDMLEVLGYRRRAR